MHFSSYISVAMAFCAVIGVVADSTSSSPSQTVSGLETSTPNATKIPSPDGTTEYMYV